MFHDVLECLCRAQHVDAVAVVTPDPRLLDLASRMGAQAIDEGSPRGLNAAAALGTKYSLEHGATSVLIVLSDLPLITVDEIDSLFLDLPPEPHVRLARSHEGLGTNALLRTPPMADLHALRRSKLSGSRSGRSRCERDLYDRRPARSQLRHRHDRRFERAPTYRAPDAYVVRGAENRSATRGIVSPLTAGAEAWTCL